jgi:hypothetical protein
LAELQSFLADNDDRLAVEARCRAHERFGVAVFSAWWSPRAREACRP